MLPPIDLEAEVAIVVAHGIVVRGCAGKTGGPLDSRQAVLVIHNIQKRCPVHPLFVIVRRYSTVLMGDMRLPSHTKPYGRMLPSSAAISMNDIAQSRPHWPATYLLLYRGPQRRGPHEWSESPVSVRG